MLYQYLHCRLMLMLLQNHQYYLRRHHRQKRPQHPDHHGCHGLDLAIQMQMLLQYHEHHDLNHVILQEL